MGTKIETAEKIVEIFQLIGTLDKDHIKDTIEYCETKESTYGLFHTDNLENIRNSKNRAKGLLEFIKILEDSE